jgi:cobalt-zinc-cadmium efflux system outer membrane protein
MDTHDDVLIRISLVVLVLPVFVSCAGYDQQTKWPEARSVTNESNLREQAKVSEQPDWKQLDQYPDPSGDLRIADALLLALKYNPELQSYQQTVRARDAAALQASLYPNPKLGLESEEFGGSGNRSGFENAEFAASVSQLILLGDELENRTDVAEARRDLSAADYQVRRITVFTEVVRKFFRVLALQNRLDLAKQTRDLAEQVHNSVTERVEVGEERPVEQSRSRVALENERLRVQQIRRKLKNARTRLAEMWGSADITFDGVNGSFRDLRTVPDRQKLLEHVRKDPRITRWDLAVKKQKEQLQLEQSESIPNPTLKAGVQRKRFIDQTFGILAVQFPLQIFDRNQGAIQAAKHELKGTKWERRSARKEVLTRFTEAYRKLNQRAQEVKRIQNTILPKSRSAFEKIQTGYDEGAFSLIDVLDARRTLFQTRSQLNRALSRYHAARAKVESFVGTNLESIQ